MTLLRERLLKLKGQPAEGQPAPPESLSSRLNRLRAGGCGGAKPEALDDAGLAERLGGRLVEKGVILVERQLPLDSVHGNVPLSLLARRLKGLPEIEDLEPERLLFLDTETTGLAGGSGTLVFLLGLARVEGGTIRTGQFLLSCFDGERAMLAAAATWAKDRDMLVSYNGKSFDLPLLATRFRLSDRVDPFSGLPHLDLLYGVRRAFSKRWRECTLQTAERRFLGFFRQDDLPGSAAPESWRAWLKWADAGRLPGICEHNYWDLVSLTALLPRLCDCHRDPARWDADVPAIARRYLKSGQARQAFRLLWENRERLDASGLLELARQLRRNRRWREAATIWENLARTGSEEAREQMAKYYEHVSRDYEKALSCLNGLPAGAEQLHRRLMRKLGRDRRLPELPV